MKEAFRELSYRVREVQKLEGGKVNSFEGICKLIVRQFPSAKVEQNENNPFPDLLPPAGYSRLVSWPREADVAMLPLIWTEIHIPMSAVMSLGVSGEIRVDWPADFQKRLDGLDPRPDIDERVK